MCRTQLQVASWCCLINVASSSKHDILNSFTACCYCYCYCDSVLFDTYSWWINTWLWICSFLSFFAASTTCQHYGCACAALFPCVHFTQTLVFRRLCRANGTVSLVRCRVSTFSAAPLPKFCFVSLSIVSVVLVQGIHPAPPMGGCTRRGASPSIAECQEVCLEISNTSECWWIQVISRLCACYIRVMWITSACGGPYSNRKLTCRRAIILVPAPADGLDDSLFEFNPLVTTGAPYQCMEFIRRGIYPQAPWHGRDP